MWMIFLEALGLIINETEIRVTEMIGKDVTLLLKKYKRITMQEVD